LIAPPPAISGFLIRKTSFPANRPVGELDKRRERVLVPPAAGYTQAVGMAAHRKSADIVARQTNSRKDQADAIAVPCSPPPYGASGEPRDADFRAMFSLSLLYWLQPWFPLVT
jgi:hypothetical protein